MEDRYPDVDPEEAEYVDYMLATGEGRYRGSDLAVTACELNAGAGVSLLRTVSC